ncbi:MAG: hypothetical protein KF862_26400 [Chitinophagaceae bacterium]|nr:hypothetical protein [Chitinophagaceae bacterium]
MTKLPDALLWQDNCNRKLLTGYRSTGIKTAGALHRLLFGTGEASLLMCQKLCRKFFFRATVQQKFYSSYCNSIPAKSGEATGSVGRSHISEEVFVMKAERRASVIWSNYFETTRPGGNDDERNDKIITN